MSEIYKSKKIRYDYIVAILILVAPYITFLHLTFDTNSDVIRFLGINYHHGWHDNSAFIWIIINHLYPIILLWLFYLHTGNYWRYVLLLVIAIELNGLTYMISSANSYFQAFTSVGGFFLIVLVLLAIHISDILFLRKYARKVINWSLKDVVLFSANNGLIHLTEKVEDTIVNKNSYSFKKYTCQLYYLRSRLIENINNCTPKNDVKTTISRKSIRQEMMIVILLLLLLPLFRLHILFPYEQQKIDFLGYSIGNFGFKNISDFVWYTSRKIIFIILFSFWLSKCKHWWKWAILSPLSLLSYQFWEAFIMGNTVEELSNLILLPLVFVSLLGVIGFVQILKKSNKASKVVVEASKEIENSLNRLSQGN